MSFAQPARARDSRFAIALVSALTLIAVGIEGYHPYAEDGGLYLAGVERMLNPALFPHGSAFVLEPTRHSLFAATVAAIVRAGHVRLPVALFGLHLLSVAAMLFATWLLASRCWPSRAARAGAVALVACWLSLPVAGTALVVMDPYLTARSFSTPCMVLALVGMLDATAATAFAADTNIRWRGILLWLISIAVAAAMHPLMAAYAFAATLALACVRSRRPKVRTWGTAALALSALATAAWMTVAAGPESAAYRRIVLTRSYWFPAEWAWYEIVGLVAPIAILILFAIRRNSSRMTWNSLDARSSLCRMAVVVGGAAWLVASMFARSGASTHLLARLQPLRIFQVVYLVMTMMLGAKLGAALLRDRIARWAVALLLLGGIMFAANRQVFPHSPHLELPRILASNRWVEAFAWIRNNTPQDALFALDADYIHAPGEDAQCFRAIAERSALPDYSKDGGEASIAPDLTDRWIAGQQAQQGLNAATTTDDMRIAALAPYSISWVVLNAQAETRLRCPYANAAAKVCRLR